VNRLHKPEEKLAGHRIGVTYTKGRNVVLFNRVSDGGWRETWLHQDEAYALLDWLLDVLPEHEDIIEGEE
jgi:hypothetical protein